MAENKEAEKQRQEQAAVVEKQRQAAQSREATGRQPSGRKTSGENEGDDPTVDIGNKIDPIIDELGALQNDDETNHPSIGKAITRLKEAQQALHEYRAKRGLLPHDQFPPETNEGDNPV